MRKPIRDAVGTMENFPGSRYDEDELEYLKAVDAYRRRTGRKFLLATDYLHIAVRLGYRRVCPPEE